MECPNSDCREEVFDHLRHCVVCGADAKAPNVRAANKAEEVEMLQQRVITAAQGASFRGCSSVLEDFRRGITDTSAVVCRSIGKVNELLSSDNQLFATFYQSVHGDARLPEDNEWDRIRQSVDSLLFPYYFEEIRFATLSLDGSGVTGYGDYCVVLRDTAIKDRASVFEENTILFVKHHQIVPGNPIPLGYRASWEKRSDLVIAKLAAKLTASTQPSEYQSILIASTERDADFIEVHVFGPIHRKAIKHLSGPEPRQRADKVIFQSVKKKLNEIGATLSIRK